jgi:Putative glycosyl hydrolase domain
MSLAPARHLARFGAALVAAVAIAAGPSLAGSSSAGAPVWHRGLHLPHALSIKLSVWHPGYRNPMEHPYQIVHLSLEQARGRTALQPLHFRPWLQAFRDYAFGGRSFAAGEIRDQIDASEHFGADGWMLWNPRNQYSADGLKP